jgi:hypothetical protein
MRYQTEYHALDKIMDEIEEVIDDAIPVGAAGELVNAIAALRRAQGHLDT